ncbi:type VII secretion target [Microbacterium sp. SORGH_AS_0888]|uniref:type VII secretion target n=1 Tax=Microbacterium sp. SORGH_AS_0888 TaxID=3041791 RepID=UPI0027857D4D|nr:type VII secretion target [Microbacterium sp. SORGH_AS_0888]MDQ1131036.1 hypothetical protein [Microbacterium sp. SORGH_AS_0888]
MSAGEIRIDPDVLLQHASKVDQLASDAAEAVAAIQSVNLSGGAFGPMCMWMIPPVAVVSAVAAAGISAEQGLITRTATEARGVVRDFDAYEQSVRGTIQGLDKALG